MFRVVVNLHRQSKLLRAATQHIDICNHDPSRVGGLLRCLNDQVGANPCRFTGCDNDHAAQPIELKPFDLGIR